MDDDQKRALTEALARAHPDIEVSSSRAAKLEEMTDAEVAEVCAALSAQTPIFDALADLLHTVEGRLKRAGGGMYRECSYCDNHGDLTPRGPQWVCAECLEEGHE